MESWFETAERIESIEPAICFLLHEDFEGEPLRSPKIPRHVPSLVRTTEALGNESELAKYYSEILRLARANRISFNEIRHYFWLRLWLGNPDAGVSISFPWYDTLSEIIRFIDAVTPYVDGQMFFDVDQSWELEMHGSRGDCFLRLRDPDEDETHATLCFSHEMLIGNLRPMQRHSVETIQVLSKLLDKDLWTDYVDWPTFLDEGVGKTAARRRWWIW